MARASWASFAAGDLPDGLERVRGLLEQEPDPAAPYAPLYAAADALGALAASARAAGGGAPAAAEACAARLDLERGLALLQTDLLGEGEPLVAAALAAPPPPRGWRLREALRARNALGALWCDRGDNERALEHLQQAEAAYCAARAAGRQPRGQQQQEQEAPDGGLGEGVARLSVGGAAGAAGAAPEQQQGQEEVEQQQEEEADWDAPLCPIDMEAAEEAEFTQTREHPGAHGRARAGPPWPDGQVQQL
jgi:tetratricopeptide (TPR) repeat protein